MTEEEIVNQLNIWNKEYRAGMPSVPDLVYDNLLEKLPEDHPYRYIVEPEELYKGRIKHNKPMLSMQKAKKEAEIERWVSRVKDAVLKAHIPFNKVVIRCTAKLDGIAGKSEDGKYVTRGDGQYGNDVSDCIDKGIVVDCLINPCLGEFVVKKDYFEENLSIDFSHPRNFVSGAIMSDTLNSQSEKAFKNKAIVFQSYHNLPAVNSLLLEVLEDFREIEKDVSDSVNYQIDGVIFEVRNKEIKDIMGETEHHPNWAIALKPKDKTYESTIIDIKWQTGRTGKVTPVVHIEPVIIDGVEVRKASGHNAKMIKTMGIDIGKKVELIRSGSVIPYIIGVIDE